MTQESKDITSFFDELEANLEQVVPTHYFDRPRRFRSLLEVIDVLGSKIENTGAAAEDEKDSVLSLQKQNPAYNRLLEQRDFILTSIEEIVKFQHGSLNHCVETMGDVLGAYTKSRDDVGVLRQSIGEIKDVLLSKKNGQTDIKNLWLRKAELEESLRMLNSIENLKDAPMRVQLHTQQHRYLAAVNTLNGSVKMMFEVDYVQIEALAAVREQLMNQKEVLLEVIADKLKAVVVGSNSDLWDIKKPTKPKFHENFSGSVLGSALGSARGGMSVVDDDRSAVESDIGYSEVGRSVMNGGSVFSGRTPPSSELGSNAGSSEAGGGATRTPLRTASGGVNRRAGGGQQPSSSFFWSTDMSEATETKEAALSNPQAAGSLFIRLLVKGVSALQCEDDMERMIFEGTHEQFKTMVSKIKSQRIAQAAALKSRVSSITEEIDLYRQHVAIFASFVKDVLSSAHLMLKMVFYVLKLIDQCKRARRAHSGGGSQRDMAAACELKESAKKEVLLLWTATENIIMAELSRHFVEKDVEDMEDDPEQSLRDSAEMVPAALARRSSGTFLGINFQHTDIDGEEEDVLTVCPPSCRLAAPVYKDIMTFSAKVKALLGEEIGATVKLDSIVEKFVQSTLDNSLLPLIQSEVNTEMQELQMDSSLFTSRSNSSGMSHRISSGDDADDQNKICEAVMRCARVVNPLFYHWFELPQHQDMVLTILDRVVRGFISTAKDEVESLSWQFLSAEKHHQLAILGGLQKDPLLAAYRNQIFDGKSTIEELLDVTHAAVTTSSATQLSPSRGPSLRFLRVEGSQAASDAEFATWGEIWDIQNTHTALGDKVVTDFTKLNTIASIAYGCDWLTKTICTLCTQVMLRNAPTAGKGRRARLPSAMEDPVHVLHATVQSVASSLMKLSETCMSLLRGEMEVACLHFLRQLILLHVRGSAPSSLNKEQATKSAKDSVAKGANVLQEGDNNIVTVFNHHLISCQDAVLTAASPGLLSVAVSPLCKIIPMFFTKSLVYHIPTDFFSISNIDRMLKSIVACQQNFSILLESCSFDPAVSRRMQDGLSDEFDRVRCLMNLINMKPSDFKEYIRSHRQEFTKDEYEFVWKFLRHRNLTSRLPIFSELWEETKHPFDGSMMQEESSGSGSGSGPPPALPSLLEKTASSRRGSVKSRRSSGF